MHYPMKQHHQNNPTQHITHAILKTRISPWLRGPFCQSCCQASQLKVAGVVAQLQRLYPKNESNCRMPTDNTVMKNWHIVSL